MRNKQLTAALLAVSVICLSLNGCSSSAHTETTAEEMSEQKTAASVESVIGISSETGDDTSVSSEVSKENSKRGSGEKFSTDGEDTHALSAEGEEKAYDNIRVEKTGGSAQNDEADFYGTNAAVFASDGANLKLSNSYIITDGSHANAVFSYGEGTTVEIRDSTIETTSNNSGGIMVTGGGVLNASNLEIRTQGGSSAAIRSDRGGGTMSVTGGTYDSYGKGSPAIYSTADITVTGAKLYSDISQAVVVEGKNSVTLIDTEATGKHTVQNSDNTNRSQAVMVYQSMSGDADEGKGAFSMTGGSLTSQEGGMFFVTNTVAEISLDHVELQYATDDLLRIEAAGWGNEGSNGGQVTLTAKDQSLDGVITVDEISTLNLIMNGSSSFEGAIDSAGKVYVELNDEVVWKLTADTTVSGLTCSEKAINLNGHTLIVDGKVYQEGTASSGTPIEVVVENKGNRKESSSDGNAPQKPDETGEEPPQKPDGADGEPPQKPDGADGEPPQKPDGADGEPPQKPDGSGGEPPQRPESSS